jgi:hypothetical protein
VTLDVNFYVKGHHRRQIRWHIGTPMDTTADDRTVNRDAFGNVTGKVDLVMDLLDSQKVPLSVEWTDAVGNPANTPADATAAFTVDDPTIINLTDNGDGSAVAAATGTIGQAVVHVDATGDGQTVTGDLMIMVVAGMASRISVVAGAPEDV